MDLRYAGGWKVVRTVLGFTYLLSNSHFHSRAVSALRFFFFALPKKETKKSRLTNIHLNLSFIA